MRRIALVALLAGCRQLFGLEPPQRSPVADSTVDVPRDAPVDLGPIPDTVAPLQPCDGADFTLVACFDFDGSVVDGSPSALPVMVANVSYVPGELGSAAALDATSSIHIPEAGVLDLTNVSVEAWVKLAQLPVTGARMGVFDNDGEYGMFVLAQGVLECTVTGTALPGATLAPGRWTHVACVYDGTMLRQYVDGVQTGTIAAGPPATTPANGTSLGGNSPSGDPLLGDMDLARIYADARSPQQICADAGRMACP